MEFMKFILRPMFISDLVKDLDIIPSQAYAAVSEVISLATATQ